MIFGSCNGYVKVRGCWSECCGVIGWFLICVMFFFFGVISGIRLRGSYVYYNLDIIINN